MQLAALTTLLILVLGYTLAWTVLHRPGGRHPWAEAVAWAPAVGFGGLSVLFFAARMLELAGAGRRSVAALGLAVAAAAAVAAFAAAARSPRQGGTRRPSSEEAGPQNLPMPQILPGRWSAVLLWAARAALAVAAVGLLVEAQRWALTRPFGTADAINIWNARARFLLFSGEPLPELLAALFPPSHPDYPLLLPGSVAAQAGLWGGWDPAIPQATGAAFLLGLGMMLHVGLRRLGAGPLATAGTALVLAAPVVWRWAFAQGADLPVAYLALAAAAGLASHLRAGEAPPASPLLTGWALGMLAWTKNEGIVLALILGGVFFVAWLASCPSRAGLRRLLAVGAGAAPGFAALLVFKLAVAPPGAAGLFLGGSPGDRLADGERWSQVLDTLGAEIVRVGGDWLGVVLFLVVALAALATRRSLARPPALFLLASLALACLGYLLAYVLSPYPAVWHVSTSAERLVLQLFPLAVLWALPAAGAALTAGSRATSAAPPARH